MFLDTGHDIDVTWLTARPGHLFPARLLDSQFDDLAVPDRRRIHLSCPPMARQRSSWRRSSIA
jgi:gluconate kinase